MISASEKKESEFEPEARGSGWADWISMVEREKVVLSSARSTYGQHWRTFMFVKVSFWLLVVFWYVALPNMIVARGQWAGKILAL
jgi:hypothetical protein